MEHTEIQSKNEGGRKNFLRKALLVLVFGILVFGIGFDMGKISAKKDYPKEPISIDSAVIKNKDSEKDVDFSLYWKVWDILRDKYVDSEKLDANEMLYGSINGMLYSTGDPYTAFLSPEDNKKFNEEIEGNFEGIGAELGVKNGILTVIAPLEGAPAEKAGLRAGDKIIKINGSISSEMTLDEAVSQIRGNKDTAVTLTIFREGNDNTFDVEVTRDVINVKSVKFEIKDNNIAYIKISRFGDDTVGEFSEAVLKAKNMQLGGLVLDLRNNPGGYLEGAVDIASKMIPKGKVVLIQEDAEKKQKKTYAKGGDVLSDIKTIVLINEGSASASEILAGALNDNRENVTLLGVKSFGKGSVQELIELPQGTAAKITVAHWLTPSGKQISEKGIEPEIEVKMSDEDYEKEIDPQLDRALEEIKK